MFICSSRRKNAATIGVAGLVLAATVIAPLGTAHTQAAAPKTPVTITYWSQNLALPKETIPLFERTHPGIKINQVIVTNYNTKVRTALKAGGSGAPDALQMQYNEIPSYLITNKLLDLSPYGAATLKQGYIPWVWGQVSRGAKVYAIPADQGPVAMLYRKDILDKYHLAVPTTWAQYAQEAVTLHKATPTTYLGNSPVDEFTYPIFQWQAGARPFKVNGSTIAVDFTDAASLKVANYWGGLIAQKALDTTPAYTPSWYTGLDRGRYATWICAAWGPLILKPIAKASAGKWRVAELPQWTPGAHVSANYGGSSYAVTVYSQHPKEAAIWAEWLGSNSSSQLIELKNNVFPTLRSILDDPKQMDQPDPFFGGQAPNAVFARAARGVDTGWQFSPFDDYATAQLNTDLATAEKGKSTFAQAMRTVQTSVVSYAKAQGFTVQ